jgi:hypothetical protein
VAGRLVTEQAVFTDWFATDAKGSGVWTNEIALPANVYTDQTWIVYEAWKDLEAIEDLRAPAEIEREQRFAAVRTLKSTLETAIYTLRATREQY